MPCDHFECTATGYCARTECVKKIKCGFLICPDLKISSKWDGFQGETIHFNGIIQLNDEVIKSVDDGW